MTIQSTAHTTQARRTPPRSQEKKSPSNKRFAQVKIVSEPGKSITDFPDEGGDWYFFRVDHVNSNCKQWTINCREWQISWVIEQQGCNVQLCEGLHFHYVKGAVQVENGWEPRHVLDKDFHLLEPEPEEPPMTWSQPGQEVPVVVQPPQALIDVQTDEIAVETLRRFNRFRCCCTAAGLKPTPSELIAAMQANHSSVCIDASKGVTIRQRNS